MNSRLLLPAVVTFVLLQLGIALTLGAQCSVSVSPAYDAPSNSLVVTATLGSRSCGIPGIAIAVEGSNVVRTDNCATSAGCTLTFSYNTSCYAPGSHAVTATSDCNQLSSGSCARLPPVQSSSSFTVPDATPQASVSIERTSDTSIRVHGNYTFVDAGPGERGWRLEHYWPNGSLGRVVVGPAENAMGEGVVDFTDGQTDGFSCWPPGAHRFVFTAIACGRYTKQVETTFTMPDETPTLSTALVNTSTSSVRVDLAWTFPTHVSQRSVTLHHFYPDGHEENVSWFFDATTKQSDSQPFDTTCWPNGAHVFKAFAIACDRTSIESEQNLVIDHRPQLDLSVRPTGGGGDGSRPRALLTYQFSAADNPAGRTIAVEFLPEFPATVPIQVRKPFTPDANTPNPLTIDVPDFGTSGILRARVSNSCGESVVKDAHIDCDCRRDEGQKTVPNPVRLWNGSMTYSESDPLPSDGLPLFAREYDTLNKQDGVFGVGWHSVFDAGLVHLMDGSIDTITIRTEDERRAAFIKVGGLWTQSWPLGVGAAATLTSDASGWRFRDGGSSLVRIYRADGRFGGFEDLTSSKKVLIDYSASGSPLRVYATDGTWSCSIAMAGNHIDSISVDGRPDLVWQYGYDGSLLQSVTLAGTGSAWRSYQYTGGLLSSVHDAAGALIESHTYDAQGRAIDSIGGSTTDITSITYGAPGTLTDSTYTKVTYATGEVTSFEQRYVQGRQQTIATIGGCGGCGSRNMTYAIDDATGSIARSQDARGYISSFTYDAFGRVTQERRNDRPASCDPEQDVTAHCRLSPSNLLTAALQPTAASTFTGYTYLDPLWPDKPTFITTPSVMRSGDMRVEAITYDALTGTLLTRASNGWTTDSTGNTARVVQTTTITLYDGNATAAFNPGRNFNSSWLTLAQPAGKKKSVDGPRTDVSDVTAFVYYPIDDTVPATNRGRLAATQNALGHVTTFENYDVFGNAGRVVDANGVATESTFDALGRLLTRTLKPACGVTGNPGCGSDIVTSNSYTPPTGPLGLRTDGNGNIVAYEYDGRGRPIALSRGVSSSPRAERIEYTYDAATGRKASERFLMPSSGDPSTASVETHRESFAYDTLAQLTAQTHADGASLRYTYDDAGSLASVRDENHGQANALYSYDPARRLSTVRQNLGSGQITTSYAYDTAGNLTSVTDPNGNITTYTYDDFGRMLSQTSPVTGTTTYAYDLAGDLLSMADANHGTTTRTYDSLGRVLTSTSAISGGASETVTRGYDGSAETFSLGRLISMTDGAGQTTYAYERRGLLIAETRNSEPYGMTTSFRYDANGNRTTLVYPSGLAVDYGYDYANRPVSISVNGMTYVSGARYLPFGPELSVSFANGTTQTRTYDTRYRIQRNTLTNASGLAIADYSYSEDAVGNITSIHDLVDAGYNRDFAYDDLNRLTVANSGTALWGSGSYRYDAMGNMLARDLGGVVEVDPNNPLLIRSRKFSARADSLPAPGSIHETFAYANMTSKLAIFTSGGLDHPLTYDAAGNETHYFDDRTYSARNLMTSIAEPSEDGKPHTINYGYDGRGVRVIRSEGTSGYAAPFASRYYVYSPELQLLAISTDNNPNVWGKTAIANGVAPPMKHEIVWFNGRPVAERVDGTTPRYTFTDHLGTPILQTDSNATVTWRAEYEPYGDIFLLRNGANASEQPLRFPGQEYERKWEGVEERYNVFRWYRSGWGRYTQSDRLGLSAGLNLYEYTFENPLVLSDRLGLYTWFWQGIPHPTPSPSADCGGANTRVACTNILKITLLCTCRCVGADQWKPQLTLFVEVDMSILNNVRPGMAHDPTIVNFQTAVDHEVNKHIGVAADAVRAWATRYESVSSDKATCKTGCANAGLQNVAQSMFLAAWNASGVNND